ncbi:alpha/beta fold hydrolase [Micromonosporaceae bacterium Da 78-11]
MVSSGRMTASEQPAVAVLPMFNMTGAATASAFGPALAGSGLREVYLDLPGHGDAPVTGSADSDAVLARLTDQLDGPVLLAGGSYGAYLAAGIARRRPDLVRGLLLVCPGIRIGRQDRDLPTVGELEAPAGWLDAAPDELRPHLDTALGHRTAEVVKAVLAALGRGEHGDEEFRHRLAGGPGYALTDEDADVTYGGPVSVVTGRQDRVVGYADQFRAMRHYPRGSFTVLDEAGHYLPFEQPALLRTLAQDWVRRTLAPRSAG